MDARTRLKLVMTPIWDKEMGHRLAMARLRMMRTQSDLASVLGTAENPITKQTVAKVEAGRLRHMRITWARLEAVLGAHTDYVLVGKDKALYNETMISKRYHEARWRALRKRYGLDPKKGEAKPWPKHPTMEEYVRHRELHQAWQKAKKRR